jgi:hypothetical protein
MWPGKPFDPPTSMLETDIQQGRCRTQGGDRGDVEAARWRGGRGSYGPQGTGKRTDKYDVMLFQEKQILRWNTMQIS